MQLRIFLNTPYMVSWYFIQLKHLLKKFPKKLLMKSQMKRKLRLLQETFFVHIGAEFCRIFVSICVWFHDFLLLLLNFKLFKKKKSWKPRELKKLLLHKQFCLNMCCPNVCTDDSSATDGRVWKQNFFGKD